MMRSALLLASALVGMSLPSGLAAQPKMNVGSGGKVIFGAEAADPAQRFDSFMLKDVVVDPATKTLRLAHSVLLTDEAGATDYHQEEGLSAQIQAKKVFTLTAVDMSTADMFFYGSANEVTLNGQKLPAPQKLVSTGWSRVKLPTDALKVGQNEIVFKGGGSLLVEPSKKPGHSFKSVDGGKTWSTDDLTSKANQQGEYLVRLRLGKYAASGSATSQVFDMWTGGRDEIGTPTGVSLIHASESLQAKQPPGTKLTTLIRLGNSPVPDDKSWTDWVSLDKDVTPANKMSGHRWGQLKLVLTTTKGQATPQSPASFHLAFDGAKQALQGQPEFQVSFKPATHFLQSGTPFVYQAPSPRLKYLREHFKLDEVFAPGKTELEQFMLLRYWIRNQWHTAWGSHPAGWMPPWDALMILQCKDQPECLTMCTHYAAVFTQCCLALGWNARHCILDHHCVSEVYSNQFGKWIMMDTGNSASRADVGLHFERDGVPLSARELHLAQKSGKTDDIKVHFTPAKLVAKIAHLCRPAPAAKEKFPPRPDVISAAELKNYPVCGLENYRRYAFPPRNNYLDTLLPGELYQGWSEYFFDGYCWVGDSPDNPTTSPEYSLHLDPKHPQEADWPLDWTRVYLSHTEKPGVLRVDLATVTPNFDHFERTLTPPEAKVASTESPASIFTWDLRKGTNTLTVRSVNKWGKKGPPLQVTVTVNNL